MLRTQKEQRPVPRIQPRAGLCASCKHLPTCTYAQDVGRPMLHCDEYEPTADRPAQRASASEPPPPDGDHAADRLGLCRTCAGRDTCTFSRPEGGVWRCEEYQ